jgi:hypothetical protein
MIADRSGRMTMARIIIIHRHNLSARAPTRNSFYLPRHSWPSPVNQNSIGVNEKILNGYEASAGEW